MNFDKKLADSAFKLCCELDKIADKNLPIEVANVVKLHSKFAVGAAWIPVPGADIAAGAATIWGMYIRINKKLEIPFSENIIKSIGSAVCTNLAGYLAMSGIGSAIKLIPGIGTRGGGIILSAGLYAITLASGFVYMEALTSLAKSKKKNIGQADLMNAVNSVLSNKAMISEFIDAAKKDYRNNKDQYKLSDKEKQEIEKVG